MNGLVGLSVVVAGLVLIAAVFAVLSLFNPILPRFACTWFGWHKQPSRIDFDGMSRTGTCPRCNKSVMQDSQGNWF